MKKFLRKFMLLKSDEQLVWAIIAGMFLVLASAVFTIPIIIYYSADEVTPEKYLAFNLAWKGIIGFWLVYVIFYVILGIIGKRYGRTEEINW